MRKRKLTSVNHKQKIMIKATRVAQQTVRYATFGRIRPHWVLPLAGYFATHNKEEEKSENSDTEPALPSLCYC